MLQPGQRYPFHILLVLSGNLHQNPHPLSNKCLRGRAHYERTSEAN